MTKTITMAAATVRRNAGARIRGLYAITDGASLQRRDYAARIEAALRGGARVLQYRDKTHDAARRRDQAQTLATLCARYAALFMVNDDIELARAVGAGVHLGRDDDAVAAARIAVGDRPVGISCYNDLARAQAAVAAGADYVAFGAFFPSPTKPNAVVATPALLLAARDLPLPRVAIGGITPDNGAALLAAGADALAAIDGVFAQADIEAAARRYADLFNAD